MVFAEFPPPSGQRSARLFRVFVRAVSGGKNASTKVCPRRSQISMIAMKTASRTFHSGGQSCRVFPQKRRVASRFVDVASEDRECRRRLARILASMRQAIELRYGSFEVSGRAHGDARRRQAADLEHSALKSEPRSTAESRAGRHREELKANGADVACARKGEEPHKAGLQSRLARTIQPCARRPRVTW
ncbi:hypothetical protein FA95DRAFT_1231086 [Auriscalpium vulgare]|uniref:Uncharacterized protein n=1 Tax=Auriscalpium vulgare TaxID=40419 RepID=A0ACB8RST1_9AGAM|nr:hypothetical protein FA95DRAFT_1231086 [Auriscalpium vulgare]